MRGICNIFPPSFAGSAFGGDSAASAGGESAGFSKVSAGDFAADDFAGFPEEEPEDFGFPFRRRDGFRVEVATDSFLRDIGLTR
jgi:hypothetical protein